MKHVLFVIILFSVLTACGSRKTAKSSSENIHDLQREQLRIDCVRMPASRAELRLPVKDVLHDLPPLASFNKYSGNARISVKHIHDTLYIEATCDSLQRLVMHYENELQQQTQRMQEKKREKHAPISFFAVVFALILALFLSKTAQTNH